MASRSSGSKRTGSGSAGAEPIRGFPGRRRSFDLRTGEVQRGRIHPGARDAFRDWLGGFEPGTDAHFALEGAERHVLIERFSGHDDGQQEGRGRRPQGAARRTRRPQAGA